MQDLGRIPGSYKAQPPVHFSGLFTNRLLTSLPGPVFATILPYLEPISVNRGEEVYESNAKIDTVYFPETAVISHLSYLADGSAPEIALIGNEGLVGLSALLESQVTPYSTAVMIGGTLLKADLMVIDQEFKRAGSFQKQVFAYTSYYLNQISQRAVCNSRHRLEERLCSWFLMVHDRAQVDQLPMTHELIADHLGARRAGITSFCTLLREYGAIAYQRGVISIVNRAALEELACECYHAVARFNGGSH